MAGVKGVGVRDTELDCEVLDSGMRWLDFIGYKIIITITTTTIIIICMNTYFTSGECYKHKITFSI